MKSRLVRIGIPLLAVLIIAAGLEYWLGGWQAVKKELSRTKVGEACGLSCATGECVFDFPDATGPEDAKIKIVAYVDYNNHCHYEGCQALHDLAQKYPDTVRFEVRDGRSEEGRKIVEQRHIESLMWLLINDMDKIRLPGHEEPIAFRGPPGAISYDLKDIEEIIKYAMTDKGAKDLAEQRKQMLKALKSREEAEPEQNSTKAGAKKSADERSTQSTKTGGQNAKSAVSAAAGK